MRAFSQKQNQPQQRSSANLKRSNASAPASDNARPLLQLQRTIGNQAVVQLLQVRADGLAVRSHPEIGQPTEGRSKDPTTNSFSHDFSRIPVRGPTPITIQTKLAVHTPGDIYEQEADHISEQLMRMPEPKSQRDCGRGTKCQPEEPSQEHQHLQIKHIGSSEAGKTSAPPSVHEVLASPGQPLNPGTRAFMEPRFGYDFTGVRIHTDPLAAQSAESVAAEAYTVGSDVVFAAGRYAPTTGDGQRLLAHELAHVMQQRSRPALQRQSPVAQQSQTIPTDLQSSANIGKMTDTELINRHDRILNVLQLIVSGPDADELKREAARIGVELARREALAAGRTFTDDSIKKMKDYFIQNAQKPAKPRKNPPPAPPGGWQDSCIVALNKAAKIGTSKPDLPTTPHTIEDTMKKMAASGHSGVAREVWFEGKGGRISKTGALRPEKLQASIWDTVMSLAGADVGWSVFTMSLLDGFHSVTLTLDTNDPSAPRIYWSDQWASGGGWKEYTRSELDDEVTRRVQRWWDDPDPKTGGHGHDTVVRVWRLRATAATSSGP
ncbi:MAG TPA: DUF4157 domain-containing protein [Pyrinomonadaceae bacterium]|nr:DUF4157 domain-containing protein [Pyrinomonadaceae bacterium]